MCSCEWNFTCPACSGPAFAVIEAAMRFHVLSHAEFDALVAERELALANNTAEPYDGHRPWTDAR